MVQTTRKLNPRLVVLLVAGYVVEVVTCGKVVGLTNLP